MNEITNIYKTLSIHTRQRARKDIPKMLRLLSIYEYDTLQVKIAILLLMELLLKDHADAFVSELHSLFPKLQVVTE